MKLATKTAGIALAATALCGLGLVGAAAASAATPTHQLNDPTDFRVELVNNSTSPLKISGYQGSDWDTVDGTPPVGTTIAKGQQVGVFVYSEGGATDVIDLKPTDFAGNLALGISQNHFGGQSETALAGSTLNVSVHGSGDGYNIVSIASPHQYSEKTLLAYQATLKGLQSTGLPAYTCPADHPWLINQGLAPGRIVPNGVSVDEGGSVGVTIFNAQGDTNGDAIGWQSGGASATNWDVHSHVLDIYAHCTNDPGQNYPAT